MSTLAVDLGEGLMSGDDAARPIRQRINQGRGHRRQFEPTWHSNLAFAAGKHWLEWDRFQRTLVMPDHLRDKELYTADVITEYRTTALGELGSDDDRPELLLRRDDAPSEDYQQQLNKAVAYGWDYEWAGDEALAEVDRLTLDLGTAAVRCRFDPTVGPVAQDNVPHVGGKPVLDPRQQTELLGNGPTQSVRMSPIKRGRICWDPLSPFNLIVPPGIPHERYFPWECVVRPVLLSKVQDEYGAAAADLKEDGDIGSVYGWSTEMSTMGADVRIDATQPGTGQQGRLRDHVWLFTYYEKPTGRFPKGRTVVLASNKLTPLSFDNQLPYQAPDGEWRSGIAYFHWWRVTGRFWSRALVEAMKDGQRALDKRRTQINEIIDRGMPFVLVGKDSNAMKRSGVPVEFIELRNDERQPMAVAGIPPGGWMQADIEAIREDLDHATGIKGPSLGENPNHVSTYSQLALIKEGDQTKRQMIVGERKLSIAQLVEDSVSDMRSYWGPQRQLMLAGEEDRVDAAVFDATRIPPFFIVKVAKGAAKPRSQAAELTKIDAIWTAAQATGVITGPNGPKWADWYAKSINAGEALDLPQEDSNAQVDVANYENFQMVEEGTLPEVAAHDVMPIHIPIHREALDQARAAGDPATAKLIQQHIDLSIQIAAVARKMWRVQDPTDVNDLASDLALDEDQALRENEMMIQNIPLNPEALAQAHAKLAQGIHPETGQPIDPATVGVPELQELLLRAALKPTFVENLQLHMDRHGKVIKSSVFDTFPPDVRHRFTTHFDLTRDLFLSIPLMPDKMTPPKVSLQLREDVGPGTVATVLHRAGVPDADAQTIAAEQPLANMVREDLTPGGGAPSGAAQPSEQPPPPAKP